MKYCGGVRTDLVNDSAVLDLAEVLDGCRYYCTIGNTELNLNNHRSHHFVHSVTNASLCNYELEPGCAISPEKVVRQVKYRGSEDFFHGPDYLDTGYQTDFLHANHFETA